MYKELEPQKAGEICQRRRRLPGEIIMIICRLAAIDDLETLKAIRLTSRVGRDCFPRAKIFYTLTLNKNRRHAADKIRDWEDLCLLRYVRTVSICSSSFEAPSRDVVLSDDTATDAKTGEKVRTIRLLYAAAWDDLYDEKPSPTDLVEGKVPLKTDSYQNNEPFAKTGSASKKFVAFVIYALRLAARYAERPLKVEIKTDQSDDDVLQIPFIKLGPKFRYSHDANPSGAWFSSFLKSANCAVAAIMANPNVMVEELIPGSIISTRKVEKTAMIADVAFSAKYFSDIWQRLEPGFHAERRRRMNDFIVDSDDESDY